MRQYWNDELIESELRKCMELLQIDRMPTSPEIIGLGRNDLHLKICRTKKYSGWAEHLKLERKSSNTLIGQNNELLVAQHLEGLGHCVEIMTTRHPYDLLVNGTVKVDVKTGGPSFMKKSRVHTFGMTKDKPTCDLYICLATDQFGNFERRMVIPSHLCQVVTLCIGKESKYNRFIEDWDLIVKYTEFYKGIA